MSMKHPVWQVVHFRNVLQIPRWIAHLPKAPGFSGSSRSSKNLLKSGDETSREVLLDKAQEAAATDRRVPKGYLVVYVGPKPRRFVIPTSFLAMPEFKSLMDLVVEEVGCEHRGGLHIPCDEAYFEEVLDRYLKLKNKRKKL